MRKLRKFKDSLIENLKDSKYSEAYLSVALEEYEKDNNKEAFLTALKDVADAQGGLSQLAERTSLNRQNLYRVFSGKGNPQLKTLGAILNGLGFRMVIKSTKIIEKKKKSEAIAA